MERTSVFHPDHIEAEEDARIIRGQSPRADHSHAGPFVIGEELLGIVSRDDQADEVYASNGRHEPALELTRSTEVLEHVRPAHVQRCQREIHPQAEIVELRFGEVQFYRDIGQRCLPSPPSASTSPPGNAQ